MWKYGGIYSDLDTVTLKSFKPLMDKGKSGIGHMFENYADIANGIMVFQSKFPFIFYVIEKFAKNYDANIWGKNGPILLAKSLLEYCDIDNIHQHLLPGYKMPQGKTVHFTRPPMKQQTLVYLDKRHKCFNFTIFPKHYFYPIMFYPFKDRQQLFNAFAKNLSLDESNWKAIYESYSVHFFDKITYNLKTKPGENSFYEKLASLYCTFTYSYIKENDLCFDSN